MKKEISNLLSPIGNLFIDAENLDTVLGVQILGHKPTRRERLQFDRLRHFVDDVFGLDWNIIVACPRSADSVGLDKFAHCLAAHHVTVVFADDYIDPSPIPGKDPVVDRFIRLGLDTVNPLESGVAVASHDGYFAAPLMDMRVRSRTRRLAVFGFREHLNTALGVLSQCHVNIYDLENDCAAFDTLLSNRPKLHSRWESPAPCHKKLVIPFQPSSLAQSFSNARIEPIRKTITSLFEAEPAKGLRGIRAAALKNQILRTHPSFKETNLGYKNFSTFLCSQTDIVRFQPDFSGGMVYPKSAA